MFVEIRKNVFVNPALTVGVFFDPAAGRLVVQTTINHHSFVLEEGEMPEASVARVVELLNSAGQVKVEVKASVRKPTVKNPQPV